MKKISCGCYRFPPEIIQQAIWLYLRFKLNLRDVEDLLAERGIMVSYLQHVQCPTSSHFCKDTTSLSRVGYEHMARGRRGRLKMFETQISRVLFSTM